MQRGRAKASQSTRATRRLVGKAHAGRPGVRRWLNDEWQPSTVEEGRPFVDLASSHKERTDPLSYQLAFGDPYGIAVMRHVEGYWRDGGWTLTGGPVTSSSFSGGRIAAALRSSSDAGLCSRPMSSKPSMDIPVLEQC